MKNNIKNVREQKSMTQKECADKLSITLRAWQTYEQGVSEPKQEVLFKIADMFNVSLDYLLGRETDEPETLDKLEREFNMSALEKEILDNYLSLPKDMRSDLMEFLQKSVKKVMEKSKSVQSNAQPKENQIKKTDVYDSELAIARSRNGGYMPAPTDEQYNSFEKLTDDMLGE